MALFFRGNIHREEKNEHLKPEDDKEKEFFKKKQWIKAETVYDLNTSSKAALLLPDLKIMEEIKKKKKNRNNTLVETRTIFERKDEIIIKGKNNQDGKGLFHIPSIEEFNESALVNREELVCKNRMNSKGTINSMSLLKRAYTPSSSNKNRQRSLSPIRNSNEITPTSILLRTRSTLTIKDIHLLEDWARFGDVEGKKIKKTIRLKSADAGIREGGFDKYLKSKKNDSIHTSTNSFHADEGPGVAEPRRTESAPSSSTYDNLHEEDTEFSKGINKSQKEIAHIKSIEIFLINKIDNQVKEIRDWLPRNFMFEMQMQKYVFEKGAEHIHKVFSRVVNCKLSSALLTWKSVIASMKQVRFNLN